MGTVFKKGKRGRRSVNLGWERGSGSLRQGPGGKDLRDGGKKGGVLVKAYPGGWGNGSLPSRLIQGGISGILRYRADGRVKYSVFCPVSYGVLPLSNWCDRAGQKQNPGA